MGHEEEDKELMMIRMETLKTMIGKLKNKSIQKVHKDTNQPSTINATGPTKAYSKESQSAGNSRPSSNSGSSPPLNCSKKIFKSNSSPTSPSPLRNQNIATSTSPLRKNKSQQNVIYQSPTSTPSNQAIRPVTFKSETSPISSHVHQSRYKLSYQSVPKVNSPVQCSSSSITPNLSMSFSSSKSHSDSELSARKNLNFGSTIANSYSLTNPVFTSQISFSSTESSQRTSKHSLSTKMLPTNSIVPLYMPTASPNLLKNYNVSRTNTVTNPTSLLKRTETHTITKPVIGNTMRNKTTVSSNKDTFSTVTNNTLTKKSSSLKPQPGKVLFERTSKTLSSIVKNNTVTEKSSSLKPQPGKVLFERTGKILFDRHATQTKIFNPNLKGSLTLNTKPNLPLKTGRLISGNAITSTHPATTRTKFFASNYIPPETSEKARTILSKYKVVRTTNNSPKKDINANYPPSSSGVSLSTVTNKNKILYERPKLVYGRGAYTKKGRVYCPTGKLSTNQYQNFVSRRLNYIKSADTNPFVKPTTGNKSKKEIILSRHGNDYQVAGNLKSLRRLNSNQGPSLKNTFLLRPASRTSTSPYSKTSKTVSAKRYVASQVLKKTRLTARKKVNKEKEYCIFYNRFGRCKRGEKCHFIHDPEKIAICARFLRGTCKDDKCLFSHKLDPDKMPVCSYFLRGECARDDCPYRHVNVGESASVCEDFLKGYCPKGKECVKKHILDCEEYSKTGSCSKGRSCILAHRYNRRKRKYSGSRPPKGFQEKRKKPGTQDEDENEAKSPRSKEGKMKTLPKFISEKIKMLRGSTTPRPTSFAGIKKFYESAEAVDDNSKDKTSDIWGNDFIPLANDSPGASDDEINDFLPKRFSFKK